MRLLFVTQVVDETHPVLGFACGWVRALSTQLDQLIVVGQFVSRPPPVFDSPVKIHSLGKEWGVSRWWQTLRFWSLLWREASNYDAVFVHMTPIWVIFAAPLCVVLRKPIYLWYEARGRGWNLRLALLLVRKVFSASRSGMPIETRRSVIVGHGIDTDLFRPEGRTEPDFLITVGRITASKHLPRIIDAFATLPHSYRLAIVGEPTTEADLTLAHELDMRLSRPQFVGRVVINSCRHSQLPEQLGRAALFLHAATTSLDKAVLEAMACGVLVVSCSPAVHAVLPKACRADVSSFPERCRIVLNFTEHARDALSRELREIVVNHHSLATLAARLLKEMAASETL